MILYRLTFPECDITFTYRHCLRIAVPARFEIRGAREETVVPSGGAPVTGHVSESAAKLAMLA